MNSTPAKLRARKRVLSLVIIAAAGVGFVVNSEMKSLHRVLNERLTDSTAGPLVVPVSPLSEHTIEFWAVDEERGFTWASVEARYVVRDEDGTRLVEKPLVASASEEDGGVKRASIGSTVHVPAGPTALHIEVTLQKGDYIDVEVYRDLPAWTALAPGIYALLGCVGIVLFLRSRAR